MEAVISERGYRPTSLHYESEKGLLARLHSYTRFPTVLLTELGQSTLRVVRSTFRLLALNLDLQAACWSRERVAKSNMFT